MRRASIAALLLVGVLAGGPSGGVCAAASAEPVEPVEPAAAEPEPEMLPDVEDDEEPDSDEASVSEFDEEEAELTDAELDEILAAADKPDTPAAAEAAALFPVEPAADEVDEDEMPGLIVEQGVLHQLGNDDLKETIKASPNTTWLVHFCTPLEQVCKAVDLFFDECAQRLVNNSRVRIASVELPTNVKTAKDFGVNSYPSMLVFQGNNKKHHDPFRMFRPTMIEDDLTIDGIMKVATARSKKNWVPEPDRVVQLTGQFDYEDFVEQEPVTLVHIHWPTCGKCKNIQPWFKELAKELAAADPPVYVAELNAGVHQWVQGPPKKAGGKWGGLGVNGNNHTEPVLLLYVNGTKYNYTGPVTKEGMLEELKARSKPQWTPLGSRFEIEGLTNSYKLGIIGYFQLADTASLDLYTKVAYELRKLYKFYAVFDPELNNQYGGNSIPAKMGMYRDKRFHTEYETNSFSRYIEGGLEPLIKWIKDRARPMVGQVQKEAQIEGLNSYLMRPLFVGFIDADWKEFAETNAIRMKVVETARAPYRNSTIQEVTNLTFCIGDDTEYDRELSELMGMEDSDHEIKGVIVDEKGRRFTRRNEDTDLTTFITDWYEGRMRPFIRSLKIPKNQEKKVVKEVVGRTFDEIVMDPTKHTLIQFYERDCGYCRALKATYIKLGKLFASQSDNIVITRMEAERNDFPSKLFDVTGYPAVYLSPKGNDSTPIFFEGNRTLETLAEFITNNTELTFTDEAMADALAGRSSAKKPKKPKKTKPKSTNAEKTKYTAAENEPVAESLEGLQDSSAAGTILTDGDDKNIADVKGKFASLIKQGMVNDAKRTTKRSRKDEL